MCVNPDNKKIFFETITLNAESINQLKAARLKCGRPQNGQKENKQRSALEKRNGKDGPGIR